MSTPTATEIPEPYTGVTINATVTEYEDGDCAWDEHVAGRLREAYPGATVEVSYGLTEKIHAYEPGSETFSDRTDEIEQEFADLHETWWVELCEDPENDAWG